MAVVPDLYLLLEEIKIFPSLNMQLLQILFPQFYQ